MRLNLPRKSDGNQQSLAFCDSEKTKPDIAADSNTHTMKPSESLVGGKKEATAKDFPRANSSDREINGLRDLSPELRDATGQAMVRMALEFTKLGPSKMKKMALDEYWLLVTPHQEEGDPLDHLISGLPIGVKRICSAGGFEADAVYWIKDGSQLQTTLRYKPDSAEEEMSRLTWRIIWAIQRRRDGKPLWHEPVESFEELSRRFPNGIVGTRGPTGEPIPSNDGTHPRESKRLSGAELLNQKLKEIEREKRFDV
ncbi:hypothetical protein V7x_00700 [Crateriforma conspicua]|uniref:Uncharacterized protein n=2 Tax=Crateriforma conspicua TaxID=2527996 RepID=A0A5C6FQL5_9PLAN|nr:hypothetical protein V7x_00700 [Crateriforma conspicua]